MNNLKILIIITIVLGLSGCKKCTYQEIYDRKQTAIEFQKCLENTAKARAGKSYSTNDDEDYDEVVAECRYTAFALTKTGEEKVCYE